MAMQLSSEGEASAAGPDEERSEAGEGQSSGTAGLAPLDPTFILQRRAAPPGLQFHMIFFLWPQFNINDDGNDEDTDSS